MVLYYLEHPAFFFKILLHKLCYHCEEEAHFLISDKWVCSPADRLTEESKNIFGITVIGQYPQVFNRWGCTTAVDILYKQHLKENEEFFKNIGINLLNYSNIYVSTDMGRGIEVYCLQKKIKYNIIESVGNCLNLIASDNSIQSNTFYVLYNTLLKENGSSTQYVYSLMRDNVLHPTAKKWIYFDYRQVFYNLDKKVQKLVLDLYEVDKVDFLKKAPINLYCIDNCERIRNTYKTYWNDAFSKTELLLDYGYSRKQIVSKPHPKSPQRLYFENQEVESIPNEIPVDLIELLPDVKIFDVITGFGTSGEVLKNSAEQIISFGEEYQNLAEYFGRIDFAMKIIKGLEIETSEHTIYTRNFNDRQRTLLMKLECFKESSFNEIVQLNENNSFGNKFVLIGSNNKQNYGEDYRCIKALGENSLVFLVMNYKELINRSFVWMPRMRDLFIPFVVHKTPYRKDININLDDEVLFVFSRSKDIREKIIRTVLKKHLSYSGVNVELSPPRGMEGKIIYEEISRLVLERKIMI